MTAEPIAPSTSAGHLKHHERIAAALAAAKLKQSMRPATAAPVRAQGHSNDLKARAAAKVLKAHVVPSLPIVGFAEGTMILCKVADAEQSVAVQDLRKGSLVKTSQGFHAVDIVASRAVTIPESADRSADRLYTLSKDKFPTLTQDLTVSGRRAILVDKATDVEKKCTVDAMGSLSAIDNKICVAVCAHADAALSSTVGATTLYNFSLDTHEPRKAHGVYANGLLVDHTPSYLMRSTEYTRLQ